jgi:hypothetical protein
MAETKAPRTFFLNEAHEHARGEKKGGGGVPKYASINWQAKGERIAKSLRAARTAVRQSPDPARETRFFLLSKAEAKIEKFSTDKRKSKDGRVVEEIHPAGKHAGIFQRLGLDLLGVTDRGEALVHAEADRLDRLLATADALGSAGPREQARWALLSDFQPAPPETRADPEWISSIPLKTTVEAIVEIQPLLLRTEVEAVAKALRDSIVGDGRQAVLAAGRDFSGRSWFRMRLLRQTVEAFAKQFQSIQSIHPPLRSVLVATNTKAPAVTGHVPSTPAVGTNLPAVAIVDAGVPREHPVLAPYRRAQFLHAEAGQPGSDDHASRVASRVVYGDVEAGPAFTPPPGRCQFLDVVVPAYSGRLGQVPIIELEDKAIQDVIIDVARNYPDVRVFDFSFGSYQPLARLDDHLRRERLIEIQDLDNFIFANDVLVVVAAGNSLPGAIPNQPYPNHVGDMDWGLGAWASGFNTLVVGAHVGRPVPGGVAGHTGWPSPFTRIGPGLAGAPVPGFSASGGDATSDYAFRSPMGVSTCGRTGLWEDAVGTSFAAPIVAREAAILLQQLQRHCAPGVSCFAATVRAFLRLVARRVGDHPFPPRVRKLADRTLGQGLPSAERLAHPRDSSAVFVWQGTLDAPGSIARVRIPVPPAWMAQAKHPSLRVVCAWNTPVSAAAPDAWASRDVAMVLKPTLGADAIRGRGGSHGSYPITDRVWQLDQDGKGQPRPTPPDGEWVVEVSYKDVGLYPPLSRSHRSSEWRWRWSCSTPLTTPSAPKRPCRSFRSRTP